ncbi:carboxylesterase 15-like [Aristolochia californica]|uniref:carboxylesterase 15-like n=1 Tax=Aristolochia californica TaxID=171875 RepID=UPI0035DD933C
MASSPLHEVENCRNTLRVFSDGSIVRSTQPSFSVPIHDDGTVLWKDVEFNTSHHLSLRLYKPISPPAPGAPKFPIFYYFHGGGFCIGSRTWPNCQNYCLHLARELQAVVVAPDYRLAPENRLPAALHDSFEALKWLQAQAVAEEMDVWLTDVADFGRVFISGDSAGGSIAHYLAVRLGAGSPELEPIRARGYVYLAPFFGGTVRTKSEETCPQDAFFPLELNDRFWRLSLPEGENADHPISNPFGSASPSLERVELDPILVVVGSADLLRDRAEEYALKLQGWGKRVQFAEFAEQQHGFFTINPFSPMSNVLMRLIKRFMAENSDQ